MNIERYMATRTQLIEQQLDRLLMKQGVPHQKLYDAARYSLLNGGKRIRPLLTLATVEAFSDNLEDALIPACALEMVHTYSLIHDDLPSMDDDDFRRGKPSLHKAFPEGHAILTGDFLLTYAFELLASAPRLDAEQKVQLITILSQGAGGEGMIAGQVLDLEAENKEIDLDQLQLIHHKKTGAMISASIAFGGIIAALSPEQSKLLESFAQEIGLAFQIVDDILDVTASEVKHGKAVASDVINGKTTYVTLLGLEESKKKAQDLYGSAIHKLKKLAIDTTMLGQLASLIVNRTK